MPRTKRPSVGLDDVKQAAAGRWGELLTSLGGLSPDLLDGQGHPCPKCGGTDRFAAFREDFEQTGGLICRQCFDRKNADGLAALQWLLGWDFPTALQAVADHLGLKLSKQAGGAKSKRQPDDRLEFLEWYAPLAALWCLRKPGIRPESIPANGGRLARYLGRFTVIALPVYGAQLDFEKPCGWVLWNTTGGTLPKFDKSGAVVEWVKMKTTAGSQAGLMGQWGLARLTEAERVWKVEGPGDMLALWGIIPPDLRERHLVVTNSAGTDEKPQAWYGERLQGLPVCVLHDADRPGQGL